jgi:hypothetical protein
MALTWGVGFRVEVDLVIEVVDCGMFQGVFKVDLGVAVPSGVDVILGTERLPLPGGAGSARCGRDRVCSGNGPTAQDYDSAINPRF